MIKKIEERIKNYIKESKWIGDDGRIECYTDYRDRELSNRTLKEIFDNDYPRDAFNEKLNDWAWDYAEGDYSDWDEIVNDIKAECSEEELAWWEDEDNWEHDEEVKEIIRNTIYYEFNPEDFNMDLKVNILLDCDNANYEFTCDNILNYCGNGGFDECSSMLWLARQQGKEKEIRDEVEKINNDNNMNRLELAKRIISENYEDYKDGIFNTKNTVGDYMENIYYGQTLIVDVCKGNKYFEVLGLDENEFMELKKYYNELIKSGTKVTKTKVNNDKFVESCIQEMENLTSRFGTLTFLVKIPLLKLLDILELQKKEYKKEFHYEPSKNVDAKSYIVLGKETECGLFDPFDGAGSCLEIKLDKDVKIPLKFCKFCVDGTNMYGSYDVNEVYGLMSACWGDTLKEVVDGSKAE